MLTKIANQTTCTCLPVTALLALHVGQVPLILSGRGPLLTITNADNHETLLQGDILRSGVIHGITSRPIEGTGSRRTGLIALWGGSLLYSLILDFSLDDTDSLDEIRIRDIAEYRAQDWILDVIFCPLHFDFDLFLVTAHNAVLALKHDLSNTTASLLATFTVASELDSLCYSGRLGFQENAHVLVAVGTTFGQLVVWSVNFSNPRQPIATTHHVYDGHEGSVFGVHISNRICQDQEFHLLASCSDDRTIRIWEINTSRKHDLKAFIEMHNYNDLPNGRPLARKIVKSSDSPLAMIWGHISRIWDLRFRNIRNTDLEEDFRLVSTGEDGTCQQWTFHVRGLPIDGKPAKAGIHHTFFDHHHAGKNIWSMAFGSANDQQVIYTGGADGQIVIRVAESALQHAGKGAIGYSKTFQDILNSARVPRIFSKRLSEQAASSLKQYLFAYPDSLLAMTDGGQLLCTNLTGEESHKRTDEATHWTEWEQIEHFNSRSVLSNDSFCNLVFIGTSTGELFAYEIENQTLIRLTDALPPITRILVAGRPPALVDRKEHRIPWTRQLIVICSSSIKSVKALWITNEVGISHVPVVDVTLPDTFIPTSAAFLSRTKILVLGSLRGAVALYHPVQESGMTARVGLCIWHIHKSDNITSIVEVPVDESHGGCHDYVITTGRDGTYAVHKVKLEPQDAAIPEIALNTVHRSFLPFGPNIEGAYFATPSKPSLPGCLILFGFRSKHFVVWNEKTQSQVFQVDCGGAHRTWTYSPYDVWSDRKSTAPGGIFAWTRSGKFNVHGRTSADHAIIQPGGHGREIKALAVSSYGSSIDGNRLYVATGAEDTSIRLFAVSKGTTRHSIAPSGWDNMMCVRTMKRHTTGLQHLAFSDCGRFLFSSAGCEELFAWHIDYDIPGIEFGMTLDLVFPKEEADSDLRVTNFELQAHSHEVADKNTVTRFLVVAVYSNSTVKVFQYCSAMKDGHSTCEVLYRMQYQTNCLTQISLSARLYSSSTDGHVTLWRPLHNLGALNADPLFEPHKVHQSSIKIMNVLDLSDEIGLVITGGDDNALGLTLWSTAPRKDDDIRHNRTQSKSLLLPDAHAAAVTAICTLHVERTGTEVKIYLASTGNDQIVKLWHVTANIDRIWEDGMLGGRAMGAVKIEPVAQKYTSVADVGAMEVIFCNALLEHDDGPIRPRWARVVIVGVGMEILQFTFSSTDGLFRDAADQ